MGSKKLQIWLPLIFAVVLALGMYLGYQLKENTTGPDNFFLNAKSNSLQEILDLIKNKYVDNVSADSIEDAGINEMLSHLAG